MSIAQGCPYDNENCKYEIFAGEPIFKKCKFCSRNSGNKGKQIEGVTMTHEELCEATARKYVQTFALWEVKGKWENPDVITWNSSGRSTIFEIKMNRADFLADFKKKCRQANHKKAGCRFAYVCYGDFIKKEEIPEDWGLYYFIDGKFKEIKYPSNNFENWDVPNRDWQGEIIMLVNFILCNKYFNQQRFCFNKRYKKYEKLLSKE